MSKKLNRKVPQLRFSEFEGDWKISNIEDSCEVKNNLRKPISLPERALMQGSYPYYGPTGIIDYLDEYGLDGKFALIGEDGDHFLKYKSWSQTQLVEGKFNANNHVHIISGTEECLAEWFFVYFQHRNIIDSLTRQGAGRYKLNKASLFRLSIALPPIAEQEKIASFLGTIDTRISQLRRKHKLLQTYKRGVMQKLFSQQIRFKRDRGKPFPDWERKKLGEVFNVTRGQVLAMPETSREKNSQTPYPVYSSQTKENGRAGYYSEYLFEDAITWTTDGANAGATKYRKGKFYCTNVCGVLLSDEGFANTFTAELINSVSQHYVSYVGNPKLMNNVMSSIQLDFPCLQEQEKIADFLTAIDKKIEAVTKQIELTEQFKKGLLQKMFV